MLGLDTIFFLPRPASSVPCFVTTPRPTGVLGYIESYLFTATTGSLLYLERPPPSGVDFAAELRLASSASASAAPPSSGHVYRRRRHRQHCRVHRRRKRARQSSVFLRSAPRRGPLPRPGLVKRRKCEKQYNSLKEQQTPVELIHTAVCLGGKIKILPVRLFPSIVVAVV